MSVRVYTSSGAMSLQELNEGLKMFALGQPVRLSGMQTVKNDLLPSEKSALVISKRTEISEESSMAVCKEPDCHLRKALLSP